MSYAEILAGTAWDTVEYFDGIGCWVQRLRDEVIDAGCGILPAEVLDDMSRLCNPQG